ncbi:DUF5641 domain-containing protein [Trichonephila clavata]|uniref:DUF5641 domain-containing protein n=1 Tax=Trichonephila clavata TaxID=2740835 RepID=A0A8X6FX11_TRICU|nr:DUF5641 domain-containing protein [Trichonephila clavata]
MRMQTTKLFNKVETALLDETISLEEKFDLLSICKDQLNEKYETLKKLNSDIQDGIPDTEFENGIENSENYSERIIESRYKITKFLNERNVDNQSVVAESYGRLLCPIILKLIPSEIALDFNRKRLDYETFKRRRELLLFLKKETESREATLSMQNSDQQIISSKENFKHSPKYSNFRRGAPTASALKTNARNACVFCDNYEHDSISCKVLSIPEKREKLILGLLWDTNSDVLRFDVQSFPDDWKFNPTKRLVLKAMLKIFDPIGFIAPFSISMKMLLQETWQKGLQWDDNLPKDLKDAWENWCSEIEHLKQVINNFWRRWRKEYLLELRSANFTNTIATPSKFKIGDVVLLHEDKMPKHLWKCGVIRELFYGRDSKVRSCAVQTSSGVIKRPIQLLYKLELDLNG